MKQTRKRLADGTEQVYYYHRKTGRAIKGIPGTAAFLAAYQAAARFLPRVKAPALDIEWLINRYRASPEWGAMADASRQTRDSYFRRIIKRFTAAGILIEHLEREEIIGVLYEWRDEMAPRPMTADKTLDALRAVLSWAKKRRIVQHNWAREVERLQRTAPSRAELVWTTDLWERLLARADGDERELLLFAMYTAARQSDIAGIRWAQFDGSWLVFKPQKTARKTGVIVQLPVHALPPFAELVAGLSHATEFMLSTKAGVPWTIHNIKLRFAALKARAFPEGDPGRTFHDIRGTAISRLFNAGCTDAEVASIDGHVIGRGSMLGRYAERSRQLSLHAFQRWTAAEFSGAGDVVPFRRPV